MGRQKLRRETKVQGKNGDREKRIRDKVTKRRKFLACKRRRRNREERRLLRQSETTNRARARRQGITIATHDARTMAVDGTHGVERAFGVLKAYDRLGCDVIGLQEIRRTQRTLSLHPGWLPGVLYCTAAVSAVARMVEIKGKVE